MNAPISNLCLFCGSNTGTRPAYAEAAQQIGRALAARGMTREDVIDKVLLAAQPTRRFVTPEQVAQFAVFLASDAANAITGAVLPMDGGWTAH